MLSKINSFTIFLGLDLIIVFFSFLGIYHTYNKADLPLDFTSKDSVLLVKENRPGNKEFSTGDTLISINNLQFNSRDEIEVFIDGLSVGSVVQINYLKREKYFQHPFSLKDSIRNFI